MKTSIKIIKLLIELKEPITIREVSKKINSDYKITYLAVKELIKKEIITIKKFGNSSACSLNNITSFLM